MPSTFSGIDLAMRAIRAFQRGLDVSGHNIANVNTKGFSRQTVDFTPTEPTSYWSQGRHAIGTGVTVASINRVRDMFLEARMMAAQGDLGRMTASAEGLGRLEQIFTEPSDTGIADALTRFWDAWSSLASNPQDFAARMRLRAAGETLTGRVRAAYADLQTAQAETRLKIDDTIRSVNRLAQEIAVLNGRITEQKATGGEPNDLMDRRDLALAKLSELVAVSSSVNPDGTVNVRIAEFTLVEGSLTRTYPSTYDPVAKTVTDGTWTYSVRGGSLYGHMETLQRIGGWMTNLDTLANTLRVEVNTLHRTGINPLNQTNVDFFDHPVPLTGAANFRLSDAVLADPRAIAAGTSGNAGDGGLALTLSRMRDQTFAALGNQTFDGFYHQRVTSLAQDRNFFEQTRQTQSKILQQIEFQRQSISGVSIDEEMAAMLRYQRSYQAAAKVLGIFDQVTEDIIGILRR